jgi:DNA helicase-2/ATP-dependent DNA helicase PcrA
LARGPRCAAREQLRAARPGGEKPRILQCGDEQEEGRRIVADIRQWLARPGWSPRDFAVLFRTNEQPRVLETELRRASLPYVIVGSMSFFDRKEVRDILAYIKLLDSPDDELALRRVINTPPRGIGTPTVDALLERAVADGVSLWRIMADVPRDLRITPQARQAVARFVQLVDSCRSRSSADGAQHAALLTELLHEIDYMAELRRAYPEDAEQQSRWNVVQEVINGLAAFERRNQQPRLADFLRECALNEFERSDGKTERLERDAVVLMTLHSAKGLEFPHVYMVGMEEGILPHRRSLEMGDQAVDEERRLCYVGITRARERLTLSLSLTRLKWGKPRETRPSRFLYELTGVAERAPQRR